MSRTNIEIDDDLIGRVMQRYGLRTKREAVDYALRHVAPTPLTREEFLSFEGMGWDGDLDEMRQTDEIAGAVILVDSSAWIEYLREHRETHVRVRALELTQTLAMTDVVAMELRAGARSDREMARLGTFIAGFDFLPLVGLADFEHAADLYRACRTNGRTVRKMTDCLIAAVAIRNDVPVLHHDTDFDVLAQYTPLRIA